MLANESITSFAGKYRFLSNFFLCEIVYDGIKYPSTEHAYQASKTLDDKIRHEIAVLMRPNQAKRFGKKLKLRADWEEVRCGIMEELVIAKFSKEPLKSQLLATDDAILIEGNWWHDQFWGICSCSRCGNKGENNLGKTLMRVRKWLTRS